MHKIIIALFALLLTAGCFREKHKSDYILPQLEDIVIYQINPRVFAENNSFNSIVLRIDSIKQLGANIIWLMPIYEIGQVKSINSPYCVKDYKSVNPELGTLNDFKNLISVCHQQNIGVIIDWVPNHTSWDHVWMSNKDWYSQDSLGNIISPPGTGWNDVADLNFDNQEMRLAMIDAMKYWVTEAGVDGFRCDAVDFVPADFLQQANDSLRNIPDKKLLLLAEGMRKDHFDSGFDLNYAWEFHNRMRDVYRNDSCASLLFTANDDEYKDIPIGKRKLRFSTNHDEAAKESPIQEWINERGSMSAFATILFFPGCPMIYSSQEVGYPFPINFFTHTQIDWSSNFKLKKEYENLLSIYNNYEVLRKGELKAYPDENILLFERISGYDKYLVVINVRNSEQKIKLPEDIANRPFKNLYTKRNLSLSEVLTLQPYEYLILK